MTPVVVDTSVIVAILLNEPEWFLFNRILVLTDPVMSVATRVELEQVARSRLGDGGRARVNALLDQYVVSFIPVDERQMTIALDGARRYGRGARPMILNYGDLFSYALATARDLPLLFKGDDFGRTDVRVALDDPAVQVLTQ